MAAARHRELGDGPGPVADALAGWAERTGRRGAVEPGGGGLRFVFYGRVSTEDYQDPVTSLARQREQAAALVAGRGRIVAQFFDVGRSRYLGGRPPYGYRLADAGPHPNKAHAAWGRRAHPLEPDPVTAPVVAWMFAQRLAGPFVFGVRG